MSMKRIILFCIGLLLFAVIANAQEDIPNKDFEEWDPDTTGMGYVYFNLLDWDNPNDYLSVLGASSVFRSEDAYQGSYSAMLETIIISSPLGSLPVPGLVTLGNIVVDFINQTGSVTGGIPFSARPLALKAYVKASQAENDSALIVAYSYKYNEESEEQDTVGIAMAYLTEEISEWTEIEIPFQYLNDSTPDTINIVCISSSSFESSYEGSMLMLDKMSIELESGIDVNLFDNSSIRVYPNPAGSFITFESDVQYEDAVLKIFDNQGKLLKSMHFNGPTKTLRLSVLAKGTYFYQLIRKNEKVSSGYFIKE